MYGTLFTTLVFTGIENESNITTATEESVLILASCGQGSLRWHRLSSERYLSEVYSLQYVSFTTDTALKQGDGITLD